MRTRPRVLHVLEAIETGCARHLVDLVQSTPEVHHEVAVPRRRVGGHTDERTFSALRSAGATVHLVEMRRLPVSPRNAVAVLAVRRLARRTEADVVHGHSTIGGLVARAAALGTGARVAYTPNGIATGVAATAVERVAGLVTDRFVAVSPSERDECRRRQLVPEARLVVVPNGVDPNSPSPIDLRALLGLRPGVPLVGSVGRLVPQKAPEMLLRSWGAVAARCPEAHFVLIGDGPLAATVDALADTCRLDGRYHRIPFLPEAAGHLPSLDVFVLASRFEGGPYVPLEAMRAEVPVILTDVVGNRDTVEHEVTGLLVPAEDPVALADATLALLRDRERARTLARAGREAVRDRFSMPVMGRRTAEMYYELVALRR